MLGSIYTFFPFLIHAAPIYFDAHFKTRILTWEVKVDKLASLVQWKGLSRQTRLCLHCWHGGWEDDCFLCAASSHPVF